MGGKPLKPCGMYATDSLFFGNCAKSAHKYARVHAYTQRAHAQLIINWILL